MENTGLVEMAVNTFDIMSPYFELKQPTTLQVSVLPILAPLG